jgi:hypothetical protein
MIIWCQVGREDADVTKKEVEVETPDWIVRVCIQSARYRAFLESLRIFVSINIITRPARKVLIYIDLDLSSVCP